MRSAAALGLLLAAHGVARADGNAVFDAVDASLDPQYDGGGVRVDANAGLSSDLDVPAALTGSFEAGYDLPLCRVVGIGGSGMLGYEEGDRLTSWTGSGTLCLPLPANTLTFTLTHGQNVRSSLFERQETVRGREVVWRGDLNIRFYRLLYEEHTVDIANTTVAMESVRSADVASSTTLHLATAGGRWTKAGGGALGDRVITMFGFEYESALVEDMHHTSDVLNFTVLGIENGHYESRVAFSGAIGLSVGDTYLEQGQMQPTVNDVRPLVTLGVQGDLGVAIAGLRATRISHALFDGQIIRDDRLVATLRTEHDKWSARADGYLAIQQVVRDVPGDRIGVGGGVLEATWKLQGPFAATVRTEAGRTITAASMADPVRAEWDVRASVSLTANYSSSNAAHLVRFLDDAVAGTLRA